ncbi:MAG TPA: ferric reductase-like transmembrane domain-containing protein [bacterium]|nr:ferric reductase-like transmembrane domain-containing protein [bacterium]
MKILTKKWFLISGFYTVTGVLPLLLWLLIPGPQLVVYNLFFFCTTVARVTGLVGLGLFSGNLLLSGRFTFLDRWFGGLDTVYRFHRQTGYDALAVLSLHAAAIMVRSVFFYISSGQLYGISGGLTLTISLGLLAYVLLVMAIFFNIFLSRKLKYEHLKLVHQTLGIILFIAALHSVLISVSFSRSLWLEIYLITLASAGVLSYLWRTLFKEWFVDQQTVLLKSVQQLPGGITELIFDRGTNTFTFIPGQFMFISFSNILFLRENHPFSITSSTADRHISFAAKEVGDFTSKLASLKPGLQARLQGPFGGFTPYNLKHKRQVWIAGGIGITPFLSMCRTLYNRPREFTSYTIFLYYSVVNENDLTFIQELQIIAMKFSNFHVFPWVSADQGYITGKIIADKIDLNNTSIMICGSPRFVFSLKSQCLEHGVKKSDIRTEEFQLL